MKLGETLTLTWVKGTSYCLQIPSLCAIGYVRLTKSELACAQLYSSQMMTKTSDFGLETPKFNLDSYGVISMWQQQKIGKVAAADHANSVVSTSFK